MKFSLIPNQGTGGIMSRRLSQDQWLVMINDCRCSSLTVDQWCEQNNIKRSSYRYWFTQLKKQGLIKQARTGSKKIPSTVSDHSSDVCWAEVIVPKEKPVSFQQSGVPITLHYSGCSIQISDKSQLDLVAELIKALRSVC